MDGDLNSFGKLAKKYYPAMTAVAYCVLNDRHLAEDAVQETYARALIKLPGLNKAKKFGSWLAAICRNTAINMAHKQSRCMDIEEAEQIPAACYDNSQDYSEVHQAILALPTKTRELLTMRYFSNMSYEQISQVTGLTIAAINARLHRAKKKLAKTLRNTINTEGWL